MKTVPPKNNSADLVGCAMFARSNGELASRMLENECHEYKIQMISKDRRELLLALLKIRTLCIRSPPLTELQPPVLEKTSLGSKTRKAFTI
ncbi:hypothetical protein AVEN_258477-1 [Araneus ventricosus]|uniref:Uncharacterized protein n=1 Tax=Araneus ventricosus TaxID=182803 RepID=A0A4Y2NMX7_ARAVE|nr:hypothetical protein AVEN_258477-1 [Araneus ventricosus]